MNSKSDIEVCFVALCHEELNTEHLSYIVRRQGPPGISAKKSISRKPKPYRFCCVLVQRKGIVVLGGRNGRCSRL